MVTCTIRLELGTPAAQKALAENYKYTAIERDEELQKTFIYFETVPQKTDSGNAGLAPNKPKHSRSLEKWNKSEKNSEDWKSTLPNLDNSNKQNSLRLTDLEKNSTDNTKKVPQRSTSFSMRSVERKNSFLMRMRGTSSVITRIDSSSQLDNSSLHSSAPCRMNIKRMQSSGMEISRMHTSLSSGLSSARRRLHKFSVAPNESNISPESGAGENENIENNNERIDRKKSFYRHLSKRNSSIDSDSSSKSFYMHINSRKLQEQKPGESTPTAAANCKKKQIQEAQVEMMYSNALDVPVSTIQKKFNTDKDFRARFAAQGRNRSFFF